MPRLDPDGGRHLNRWSIARLPQVEDEQQQQQQQQDDDDDEEEEEEEEEIKGDEYSTPQRLKFMPSPESIRTVALPHRPLNQPVNK